MRTRRCTPHRIDRHVGGASPRFDPPRDDCRKGRDALAVANPEAHEFIDPTDHAARGQERRAAAMPMRSGTPGVATDASPATGNRLVCYCDDCQAFAWFLEGRPATRGRSRRHRHLPDGPFAPEDRRWLGVGSMPASLGEGTLSLVCRMLQDPHRQHPERKRAFRGPHSLVHGPRGRWAHSRRCPRPTDRTHAGAVRCRGTSARYSSHRVPRRRRALRAAHAGVVDHGARFPLSVLRPRDPRAARRTSRTSCRRARDLARRDPRPRGDFQRWRTKVVGVLDRSLIRELATTAALTAIDAFEWAALSRPCRSTAVGRFALEETHDHRQGSYRRCHRVCGIRVRLLCAIPDGRGAGKNHRERHHFRGPFVSGDRARDRALRGPASRRTSSTESSRIEAP